MKRVTLHAAEATLALLARDWGYGDWCQVELRIHDEVHPLGADSTSIVVERLARALAEELDEPTRSLEGTPAVWVLALAERYSLIYAADVNGERRLFVQARDGSLIANFALSPAERRRWLAQLRDSGLGIGD